jgi:hypothetical protein
MVVNTAPEGSATVFCPAILPRARRVEQKRAVVPIAFIAADGAAATSENAAGYRAARSRAGYFRRSID